jgi:hypothetical protein
MRWSVCLEITDAAPKLIGAAFGTSFLLPKQIGALAEMVTKRTVPILLCPSRWATVLLPKQIGALADSLFQARLGL